MYQYNNSKFKETNLSETMSFSDMNDMLNRETEQNKTQNWNKLNNNTKIEKLCSYATNYGKEHNYNTELIESLKSFLIESVNKSKLKTTKDVYYNKETKEITNIPFLKLSSLTHNFTLKNTEPQTNKKTTIKNKKLIEIHNISPLNHIDTSLKPIDTSLDHNNELSNNDTLLK